MKIVFTGGGTAGHVTLNQILIPLFKEAGYEIHYIGSKGIEKELIAQFDYVTYHTISTGKLRRYIDLENIVDSMRVIKGIFQAQRIIRKIKPEVIFSKGGFVSVPVIIGGWLNKKRVFIHESDYTMGLANKIGSRFATKIWSTFKLSHPKAEQIGAVLNVDKTAIGVIETPTFDQALPTLLFIGGSSGAKVFNTYVRENLTRLTATYNIILISGSGEAEYGPNYQILPYVHGNLFDYYAAADYVITRGGANSIFELLALQKKMIIVPLGRASSRGDQIDNAAYFEANGYATTIQETDFSQETLDKVLAQSERYFDTDKIAQGAAKEIISATTFFEMFRREIEK